MNKINASRVIEAIEQDDSVGFCMECGTEHYNIEPDARNYKCDDCLQPQVFGAEEILLRGWILENEEGESNE